MFVPCRLTVATIAATLLAGASLACSHAEPFATPDYGTTQPFGGSQLTFNSGFDRDPTWLADGSAILYTGQRHDHHVTGATWDQESDACISFLPATGGRIFRSICPVGVGQQDTVDVPESAAISPGGRLLYLHSIRKPLSSIGWILRELVLASVDSPWPGRVLTRVPAFGLQTHSGLSQVRWLDEQRFVYRADQYEVCIGRNCTFVERTTGMFVMLVDLHDSVPVFTPLPGTDSATGVDVVDADAIVYTLISDARVYRRVLSTGATTVLWDFGTSSVGDVQLRGQRLVAVLGATSDISGGQLALVDLATGTEQLLAGQFKHPALSPDGRAIVAETPGRVPDLYRLPLP